MSARTFNEDAPIVVPMRTWAGLRRVFGPGGRLVDCVLTVSALDGPNAARLLREQVAERFVRYGPKDFGEPGDRRGGRRSRRAHKEEA